MLDEVQSKLVTHICTKEYREGLICLYQIYKRADGLQSKLATLMAAIFQLWTKLWYKVRGYHQQGLNLLVLICLEI